MRRAIIHLAVLTFVFPIGLLHAQQTYHVLRSGSHCGRLTLSFETLANGYRECELREERRYTDVDDRSVTWRRTLTVLVDSAMQPVSISGREFTRDNEYRISARRTQSTLYITRQDRHGAVTTSREDATAVPDVFLPILFSKTELLYPEKVFSLRDLVSRGVSPRAGETEDGQLRIDVGDGSVFIVSTSGTIITWALPALDLAYADPSLPMAGIEPCDIDCGVYWDAGQVSLPTPPENVRSMALRLTLTREVGARLMPEDLRQSVTRQGPGDAAQVELAIRRIRQRQGDAVLPVREEEALAYLRDSPMLTVTADAVRERAAALRGNERSVATILRSVTDWMGSTFVHDDFVPLVSADRLVTNPRGSSLHASLLAVALARAAGVPARLVLGIRPAFGRWRATVWMEAWSDRWVSIDPVRGTFLDDAVHIKLLHAGDEGMLRDQARRLHGALRIDLLTVDEIDTTDAGALRTGVIDGVYTDRSYRFSVRAPRGWIVEHREHAVETEVVLSPQPGAAVRCEVLLSRYPYPKATRDVFDAKVRALGIVLSEVDIAEQGEIRVGNRKVPSVLYSYRDTGPGADRRRITSADLIFTIHDRGYHIRFTAPSEEYDRYEPALRDILRNLVLYE
ncbi:MAG: transglutaminase domain-containing protein [Bacteroidota bacterium]|jgi:transglutaminase-like putative cysteine protease|nr:transglutaminase domain-containing protein [Bacteroidota bacterium]